LFYLILLCSLLRWPGADECNGKKLPGNTVFRFCCINVNWKRSNMVKQSNGQPSSDDAILLGTTTLRRMISAVYEESNPLHKRNTYSECMCARARVESDPNAGDETVYVYYHRKEDESIMTNIEGDTWGFGGSSAGFTGKVTPEAQTPMNKP
jgi:hypothetical protein